MMVINDKHFHVFCYIQNIKCDQKSYSLYKSYLKPQYKNIEQLHEYILKIQNISPAYLLKYILGVEINPNHYLYHNGVFEFNTIFEKEYNELPKDVKKHYTFSTFFGRGRLYVADYQVSTALNKIFPKVYIELVKQPTYNDLLKYPYTVLEDSSVPYSCFGSWNTFGNDGDFNPQLLDDICQTRVIKDFCFDGERTWQLGYILYKDEPILFYHGAGRGSVDSYGHTVVNQKLYDELCLHIIRLTKEDEKTDESKSLDSEACISFYSHNLLTSQFLKH